MSFSENWDVQRETLRQELSSGLDAAGLLYRVRHAMAQTEQNTLAEIPDETLRQQAGVLFSCLKNDLSLLEVPVTERVWQAKEAEKKGKRNFFLLPAAIVQAALMLYAYLADQWALLAFSGAALALGIAAFLKSRARGKDAEPEITVTVKPDPEKLLSVLDAQMRALDRFLGDFRYLNERLCAGGDAADSLTIQRAADLLEALYDSDEEDPAPREAAKGLLRGMGLRAEDYSAENAGLFTLLPSRSCCRTMVPALLSEKDGRLLRRGTAVVPQETMEMAR